MAIAETGIIKARELGNLQTISKGITYGGELWADDGGVAFGIDRWAALFSKQTNIREVMAFPKTQSGGDLMLEAPSPPEPEQLAELGLRFVGANAPDPGSESIA